MYKRVVDNDRKIIEDMYDFVQSTENSSLLHASTVGMGQASRNYLSKPFVSIFVSIVYIENGSGIVRYGKEFFQADEGDTIILPKGQPAEYWSSVENPWTIYWFNIDGLLCDKLAEVYKLKNAKLYRNLDISGQMKELIEISKSGVDNTGRIIEITNRFFHQMYCHHAKDEPQNLGTCVKDYINDHIKEGFSIERIEKKFGKSRSQIFRVFKAQYGITPYTYYLNQKIALAKNLLINTDLPISEIAVSLDFYDEYHFSKYFKKKENVTPFSYRKSNSALLH